MKPFFEIITEEDCRYYFPVQSIERVEIEGKTVKVVATDPIGTETHIIANVSNIDKISQQIRHF